MATRTRKTAASARAPEDARAEPAQRAAQAGALGAAFGDLLGSLGSLSLPPALFGDLQADYVKQATEIWNASLQRWQPASEAGKPLPDRRFADKSWQESPGAAYTARMYLLNARTMMQMADAMEGDAKSRARLRFAVQQWVDAASPSNYLAFNPEAIRKAIDTQGQSIADGMRQLLGDIGQGHMSQTDESVFEVGRNVATTEGTVVYQNELFQLIEYKPLTAKVHELPMLFVPPCINKYYILDLQPENSVIRYTVEQGHRTFVVSWVNPDPSLQHKTWDDYIADAAIRAIEVVQELTGHERIDMLGFCVGGTIVSTALAVLAARGKQPAKSLTLLTTLLDFSDTGVLDVFIDEASVRLREMTIGAQAPTGPGLLRGRELATTFSFLRPNDLVWNYVVGNYLKGESPPPFDLLYWNSDSTNLPGPMLCWYLRHTYLQNELKKPGALTVCGEKVDLGAIDAPVFIYASREDHIVPWQAAYASSQLFKGPRRFVLGASGHIAGVINPPAKGKRSHWVNARLPADAESWFQGASEQPGSWWPLWSEWLGGHAGKWVAAPKSPGGRGYRPIEPAPGRYVKARA